MGSLLAETVEAEKIVHIVQPVKDLFASIFFVSVGMMIDPAMMWEYAVPILILTLLVLSGQVLFGSFSPSYWLSVRSSQLSGAVRPSSSMRELLSRKPTMVMPLEYQ